MVSVCLTSAIRHARFAGLRLTNSSRATSESRLTRALLIGGAVAGPAFLGTALVEGAMREDYRPVRHPMSSLAFGPRGGVQVTNFLVTGSLYLGYAVGLQRSAAPGLRSRGLRSRGLRSRGLRSQGLRSQGLRSQATPLLVGSAAIGLLGSGAFIADPVSGYPPGTPDRPAENTPAGLLHNLFALPIFVGLPAAAAIEASRAWRAGDRIWAAYSAKSGIVSPVMFGLASAGFGQQPRLVGRAGIFQRVGAGTAFAWLTALAVRRLTALR